MSNKRIFNPTITKVARHRSLSPTLNSNNFNACILNNLTQSPSPSPLLRTPVTPVSARDPYAFYDEPRISSSNFKKGLFQNTNKPPTMVPINLLINAMMNAAILHSPKQNTPKLVRSKKSHFTVGRHMQNLNKEEITEILNKVNKDSNEISVTTNLDDNKKGAFNLQILKEYREKTGTNCSRFQALKIKDAFNISDLHYRLLRKLLNLTTELRCLNVLTDLRAVFNINFKINSNYYGVYNSLPHKLKSVLLQ
jgi:hypothetical protein